MESNKVSEHANGVKHFTTFSLICAAGCIEKLEELLLPVVFLDVCVEFQTGPAMLASIAMWRGIFMSIGSLISAPLGDRMHRSMLVGSSIILWGVSTTLVAWAPTLRLLLWARALTGMCTGVVVPVCFSMVPDLVPAELLGRAVGVQQFTRDVGGSVAAVGATLLSANLGWRGRAWPDFDT